VPGFIPAPLVVPRELPVLLDDAANAGTAPISVTIADAIINFFMSQPLSYSAIVAEQHCVRAVPRNAESAAAGPS
jgi:hypothetical protein